MSRWVVSLFLLTLAGRALAQGKDVKHPSEPAPATPTSGRRWALVIGNKDYKVARPLWSPVEDARAWGEALEEAGFQVLSCYDCTRRQMKDRLAELQARIQPGDEAFFFYSGHGAEQDDRNLLFPVDAEVNNCGDLDDWTVSLNSVLGAMEQARVKVVVLDACRDAPFPTCTKASRDLFVDQPVTEGTLIAYATRRGYTASDGSGTLSPYTRAVLPLARTPGLPFIEALTMARDDVQSIAADQEPFESNSLSGEPWVLLPGPHPKIQKALLDEAERRRQQADLAWAGIETMPDGLERYRAALAYLGEHGGSGASSVLLALEWLERSSIADVERLKEVEALKRQQVEERRATLLAEARAAWLALDVDPGDTSPRLERRLRIYLDVVGAAALRSSEQGMPVEIPELHLAQQRLDALPALRAEKRAARLEAWRHFWTPSPLPAEPGVQHIHLDLRGAALQASGRGIEQTAQAFGGLGPAPSMGIDLRVRRRWGVGLALHGRWLTRSEDEPDGSTGDDGYSSLDDTTIWLGSAALQGTFSARWLSFALGPVLTGGFVSTSGELSEAVESTYGQEYIMYSGPVLLVGLSQTTRALFPLNEHLLLGPSLELSLSAGPHHLYSAGSAGVTLAWRPARRAEVAPTP